MTEALPQKCVIEGVEDGAICHYLSFSKLLRLIIQSTIFFPKLASYQQSDPYECTLWPPARYANESLIELRHWAVTLALFPGPMLNGSLQERVSTIQRIRNEIESADLLSVRELITVFEIREWADGVICNCWHLNAEESDAMWKIYSGRTGAAIFSTVKQLATAVDGFAMPDQYEKNTPWVIAPVIYRNEDELNDLPPFYVKHPWLLKRRAFEHEKELRIFKSLPGGSRRGSGHDIRVDTSRFVNKILLSPFNADWENEIIEVALKELSRNRFPTVPPIQVSKHLNVDQPNARILSKVEDLKRREESLEPLRSSQRLIAKLMLRGRMTHPTDEDWILHSITQLLEIWDGLPDGISQAVLIEEFREILKFSRNEDIARQA